MKPTDTEQEIAIVAAEGMLEAGEDGHHIARTLLYLYQRLQQLEKIRAAAENYFAFGEEEPWYVELKQAIEAAREAEVQEGGKDPGPD